MSNQKRCPDCLGSVTIHFHNLYSRCEQTGYNSEGEHFHCHECGAVGNAEDLTWSEQDALADDELEREYADQN